MYRIGDRVTWKPSNRPEETYSGEVVEHNPKGQNIFDVKGYNENRAGWPRLKIADFDRILVKADHDGKWHAQDPRGLCRE